MNNKIAYVIVGALLIGASLLIWHKQNVHPAPPAFSITDPASLEITLAQGGDFQFASYEVKDLKLTYAADRMKLPPVALNSADLIQLAALLGKYELNTLHNDPAPPPDARQYSLTVINGATKTPELNFSLPQNPGYALAVELERFFSSILKRPPGSPCGPTENCVTITTATLQASCAPWDGAALSISMLYNGGSFSAELFAKGLELFDAGKPVTVTDAGDITSETGNARFCPLNANCTSYSAGQVKIENPSGVMKRGVPTRLNIIINGAVVPVETEWDNTQALCG